VRRWGLLAACGLAACASVTTIRLQPETVAVGPGLRAVAGVQASVSSFYVLFIGIPGGVSLDRVVNRMLLVAVKSMGADQIANLTFQLDCPTICLGRLLGVVGAHARGIAVQVVTPPPDSAADDGPEAPPR
jgi:hypothetical protein